MIKLKVKQYPKRDFLTIEEIQQEVLKKLSSYFTTTLPVFLEHEFLKGNLHCSCGYKGTEYEDTVFYSLEELLKGKEFGSIL